MQMICKYLQPKLLRRQIFENNFKIDFRKTYGFSQVSNLIFDQILKLFIQYF